MTRSLLGKQLVLVSVAMAAAIPYGWRAALSAALGGGLQVVNLRALERVSAALLGLDPSGRSEPGRSLPTWAAVVLVQLRWPLFLATVAVVLLWVPVERLFFVAGLTTVVATALWHGLGTWGSAGERVR